MAHIKPPWTYGQVAALNRYQSSGLFHPFTCPNDHEGKRILKATQKGWVCPSCDYTQDWAHDFMLLTLENRRP